MILYRCVKEGCWVITFNTKSGVCPACKTPGSILRQGVNKLQETYDMRDSIRQKLATKAEESV